MIYRLQTLICCLIAVLFAQPQDVHAQFGTLWGGDFGGEVYRIDPSNGNRESVFEFPFGGSTPRTIGGLAYDSATRAIFGVTGGSLFDEEVVLFRFDPFANSPTPEILGTYDPVNVSTNRVTGVAFDGAGNFFLNEANGLDSQIIQYDLFNMSVVNVYDTPSPANFNVGGLDVGRNSSEILGIHSTREFVFSVGTPNGPVDSIGSFSQQGFTNAIAYDPFDDRYFLSDTRLVEFDPVSGATLRVVSDDSYTGLAFIAVPEPTSALFPVLCSLAFLVPRRR